MTTVLTADKRDEIVHAALETFVEHGWFDVTLEDIAQRSGARVADITAEFGTREALFAEAVAWMAAETVSRAEAELPAGGAREQLSMLCNRCWDAMRTREFAALHRSAITLKATRPELARIFRERFVDRWSDLFSRVIARGVARGELRPTAPPAARILSSALLLQAVWCADTADGAVLAHRVVPELLDVVLDGIAVKA